MDPEDREAHDLAFAYEDTPLWQALRVHFDPIRLDSPLAEALRSNLERTRSENTPDFAEAEEFHAKLVADWELATAGDLNAFWRLLWNLQFDPRTGRGHAPSGADDPRTFPAASLLEPSLSELLPKVARNFLTKSEDCRTEWRGTTRYDKRAWAGYLALALLERLGLTAGISDRVWRSWVGAILWFTPSSEADGGYARRYHLLAEASEHAFRDLEDAIPTYVIGELARGSAPNQLDLSDRDFVSRHHTALYRIVTAISDATGHGASTVPGLAEVLESDHERLALPTLRLDEGSDQRREAVHTLRSALHALMSIRHAATIATAMAAIENQPEAGPADYSLVCAESLLRSGAVDLSTLLDVLRTRLLGVQLAHQVGARAEDINSQLDEEQLALLLRWLTTLPRTAGEQQRSDGFQEVDSAQEWERQALRDLTNRRTPAALEQLNALQRRFPERLDFAAAVVTVRTAVHASLWMAPAPEDVAILLANPDRRLVRTNHELADLLDDTLEHIARDLSTHGELLWDRQRQPDSASPPRERRRRRSEEPWRPKPEAALCAYVAHELKIRLSNRGVAINREVLVRPTDPYGAGHRTDILIEAFANRGPHLSSTDDSMTRLAVVIEAKGQWNPGLEKDLTAQLAQRYLDDAQTDTGIYLVGWFPTDEWTDHDDRRLAAARKRDRANTHADLLKKAAQLEGKRVTVRILEVQRPRQGT
ncbi:hypothetical protein ACTMTJ_44890 [Phytohabitans sp. LJ34]|uniref:hypothetical protein n=1 Tax=Phytohabitans sp. LJ34 TaxID=3452217 RepID=UPI003F8BFAAD